MNYQHRRLIVVPFIALRSWPFITCIIPLSQSYRRKRREALQLRYQSIAFVGTPNLDTQSILWWVVLMRSSFQIWIPPEPTIWQQITSLFVSRNFIKMCNDSFTHLLINWTIFMVPDYILGIMQGLSGIIMIKVTKILNYKELIVKEIKMNEYTKYWAIGLNII